MGNIGSHVNLTSCAPGHQANAEAEGVFPSELVRRAFSPDTKGPSIGVHVGRVASEGGFPLSVRAVMAGGRLRARTCRFTRRVHPTSMTAALRSQRVVHGGHVSSGGADSRLWIDATPREPPLRCQSGPPLHVCQCGGGTRTGRVGRQLHPRAARRGGGSQPGATARIERGRAAAALPLGEAIGLWARDGTPNSPGHAEARNTARSGEGSAPTPWRQTRPIPLVPTRIQVLRYRHGERPLAWKVGTGHWR